MKKVLLFALGAFTLVGCEKAVLKNTSLSIASVDAEAILEINEDSKILNNTTEEALLQDYVNELRDHMGVGQIDIVEGRADYTLVLNKIHFRESNKFEESESGEVFNLSRIKIVSDFTLQDNRADVPKFFSVEVEKKEKFHCEGEDPSQIDLEDAFCEHTFKARRSVKKTMRRNQ